MVLIGFSFDCVAFGVACVFAAAWVAYDLIVYGLVCGFLNCFGYFLRLRVVMLLLRLFV